MPIETELSWTKDIEDTLEKIRILCLIRSKYHKNNYFQMLNMLKYFRIPIIILSGVNSVFNVALTNYMKQNDISLLCCFISLVAGLIGSIELFLQIQKNMEVDLLNAKEFYLNAIDISKILQLVPINRGVDGTTYLNEKFNNYSKLVESSVIVDKATHDNIISLSLISNLSQDEKLKIINKNTTVESILLLRQEKSSSHHSIFRIPSLTSLYKNPQSHLHIPTITPTTHSQKTENNDSYFFEHEHEHKHENINDYSFENIPETIFDMNLYPKNIRFGKNNTNNHSSSFLNDIDKEITTIIEKENVYLDISLNHFPM